MCRNARIKILFLPPYSPEIGPEYNPIELAFNSFKSVIKRELKTVSRLHDAVQVPHAIFNMWINIMRARRSVWCGYTAHAGYEVPADYLADG
jgi:hypothetical protein